MLAILPARSSAYVSRSYIYINGNADFTSANGVTGGGGTAINPWIIEGWQIIDSIGAITIWNTDNYFVIRGVSVGGGYYGIYFENVANGKVENSVIVGLEEGMAIYHSTNAMITSNTISSNFIAIDIEYSTNVQVNSNSMDNGLNIWGDSVSHYNSHAIATTNTVNFLPLYYYKNTDNLVIESTLMGQLILANCDNARISNLQISDGAIGILNAYCSNNIITHTVTSNNWVGIELDYSTNGMVSGNNMSFNDDGIWFFSTNNSVISSNDVFNNTEVGICLDTCSADTIVGNEILKNAMGVNLTMSRDIVIHHNNFVSNGAQAEDDKGSENSWDNGLPSGGNYWSDYSGTDSNHDGIGDSPYVIDSNSKDYYPLMVTYSDAHPIARMTANQLIGNLSTVFSLDARTSTDFEDPSGVLEVRWDWQNDGAWDASWSISKMVQHQYPAAGNYTICIEVRDLRGLSNKTTIQLLVDGTPPTLSISIPSGYIAHTRDVNISWSCTDDSSGVDHFEYSLDGSAFQTCNMSWTMLPTLSDGTHRMEIRAFDKAGNMASENLTFEVNTNIFSANGPFGSWLLIALIAIAAAIIAIILIVLSRKKKKAGMVLLGPGPPQQYAAPQQIVQQPPIPPPMVPPPVTPPPSFP